MRFARPSQALCAIQITPQPNPLYIVIKEELAIRLSCYPDACNIIDTVKLHLLNKVYIITFNRFLLLMQIVYILVRRM